MLLHHHEHEKVTVLDLYICQSCCYGQMTANLVHLISAESENISSMTPDSCKNASSWQ